MRLPFALNPTSLYMSLDALPRGPQVLARPAHPVAVGQVLDRAPVVRQRG